MRKLKEVQEAESRYGDLLWYHRSKCIEAKLTKEQLETVKKVYKELENKYGKEDLTEVDDFQWGEINGKLSALRWILGEDWDSLDS